MIAMSFRLWLLITAAVLGYAAYRLYNEVFKVLM